MDLGLAFKLGVLIFIFSYWIFEQLTYLEKAVKEHKPYWKIVLSTILTIVVIVGLAWDYFDLSTLSK